MLPPWRAAEATNPGWPTAERSAERRRFCLAASFASSARRFSATVSSSTFCWCSSFDTVFSSVRAPGADGFAKRSACTKPLRIVGPPVADPCWAWLVSRCAEDLPEADSRFGAIAPAGTTVSEPTCRSPRIRENARKPNAAVRSRNEALEAP